MITSHGSTTARSRADWTRFLNGPGTAGHLWAAISIGKCTAQGPVVARHENGTVSIDTGLGIVTSLPV